MAGLSGPDAVAAVRRAVEGMDGAGWIDVEAQSCSPGLPGGVIDYRPACAASPNKLCPKVAADADHIDTADAGIVATR